MLNLGSNSQFHNPAGIGKPDLVIQYEGKEQNKKNHSYLDIQPV